MKLIPVDNDPFATNGATAGPRLVPVEHDPFAAAPDAPPRPANVPLPPARPKDLGIGAQDFPAVQPLAGDMPNVPAEEPTFDPMTGYQTGTMPTPLRDPQSVAPAPGGKTDWNPIDPATGKPRVDPKTELQFTPGGKNNVLNQIYQALGIDPRSSMDTGTAYERQKKKAADAAEAYAAAPGEIDRAKREREDQIAYLRERAAQGDVYAQQSLQALEQGRPIGSDEAVSQAEHGLDKAREGKVAEDLRSPATVNPVRNAAESVPRTILNQGVDTLSAASRVIDKVTEPIERLLGPRPGNSMSSTGKTDAAMGNAERGDWTFKKFANQDEEREAYWARRRKAVDGAFNVDPALADTIGQQVVDGVASAAGFMAAGAAGKAAKLGSTLTTVIAGALPQGEQHWRMLDDYYKLHPEEDSQWKRWANFAIGMGSGATEAAPIGHLFQRLETAGKGGLTRILGIAAAQFGEEGVQEAFQQVIENAAKRGFMDPRTPLSEDVANSFLTAAVSGALMGGGGAAVARALSKGEAGAAAIPAPPVEAPPELPAELQAGGTATATSTPAMTATAEPAPTPNAAPAPAVEAAPAGGEVVPAASPPAPAPVEPAAEEPAPPPRPAAVATPDEAKILLGAGYTAEQIADMGPDEVKANVQEETDAGTKPVDAIPPEAATVLAGDRAPAPTNDLSSVPSDLSSVPDAAQTPAPDRYQEAVDLVRKDGKASTSYIQRILKLPYSDAQALMDRMEKEGVVGPASPSGKREVLPAAPTPGTRTAPVKVEKPEDVAAAAAVVNTEPSDGQKAAGNYQKGHIQFDGLDISIENPKGSTRTGKDPDGNEWSSTLPAHYGYVKGTKGADGDQVDVYLGDAAPNGKVWVVDQFDPKTGKFDEHKVLMGFEDEVSALWAYKKGFSDGSATQRFGGVREVSTDYLRSWLDSPGRRKRPFTPDGRAKAAGKETPPQPAPTPAPTPAESPAPSGASSSEHRPKDPVAGAFFDHLVNGGSFPNILQARKMAKEQGEEDVKKVEEAMELAVVSAAKVAIAGKDEKDAYDALVDLYKRQPNLGTRTSTSVRDQAYSTPIPLAYVAQRLAGISKTDFVYEPTAGNGALLFTADPDRVIANEINKGRADNLEAQGYTVTDYDAASQLTREKIQTVLHGQKIDVVIGNPPFGKVREDGRPKVFNLSDQWSGYDTTDIDHAIVVRTLGMMKPDGRAVFIVGAPGKQDNAAEAYHGQNKRAFFKFLWDHYNVADHFTVGGNLYSRQGTTWPVDVIVIEGRGKTSRPLPAVSPPPVLTSWDQVKEKLDGRNRPDLGRPAEAPAGDGTGGSTGAVSGDTGPAGQGESSGRLPEQEQPDSVREPVIQPEQEPAAGAAGAVDGAGQGNASGSGAKPPAKRRPPRVETGDAAFDAAFDQMFGDKPAPAPQAAPAGPRTDTRTPGQIAKSAVTETAMGLDDALSGLFQLFGGGKTIGSGPVFDEETYAKAKPFFIAAAQHLKNAAKDLVALAKAIMQAMANKFGEAAREAVQRMRPYIVRFVDDVKAGAVDLTAPPKQEEQKAPEEKPTGPPKERKSAPQEKETDKQVAYKPTSVHGGLGTLVPINMQTAIHNALEKIAAEHESVDKFVATELGFDPNSNEFHRAFAAEQIDAIALALSNFKKGAGFIIGDQTGIGKGRVNAAVIRWAIKNGKTPIFVTEKPNLYGDMYRDLTDIKIQDFLGREPKLLMTNSGQKIPLNQQALDSVAARKLAKEIGQPLPPEEGFFLKSQGSKPHEALLKSFAEAGNAGDHDVVFTTYSQMQSVNSKETERVRFLRSIAPNAVVIFDESHNAGGQEGTTQRARSTQSQPRSQTARDLVGRAQAVFYSSATFAKRPSVMDLYSKTDMRLAVNDISRLAELIKDGGVPMQQVVSTMLAEAGQYIRRERSFDGVVYDTPVLDVDRDKYDEFAGSLRSILQFSRAMRPAVEELDSDIKEQAAAVSEDGSTGTAGAESLNFTSVMHNLIGQYLLSAKVDIAADRAIAALQNGEKPVLTVANTLESFLADFAEDNDLKVGMPIEIDFSQLLIRYLDRTRTITIKDAYGGRERHYLTDDELGPAAIEAYDDAKQYIQDLDFGALPISPLDWLHYRMRKAGYTTAEITGRGLTIHYTGPGKGVLRARPASEVQATGRLTNIGKFNNETIEEIETSPGTFVQKRKGVAALILNQAGSTGLSLHANASFANQQKRVMLIVQAEANIDTHMQMLGRIHRTGQVVLPRYEQLIGNVPAEKRPAAVLQKKMASLNASTTASREGALTGKDVPDFINQYGDIVARQWFEENSDLAADLGDLNLGEQRREAEATEDGAMRKLTGRIPALRLSQQEEVYEDLEQRYADLIEQLEATGSNALEAKALDLDAIPGETATLRPGTGDSPFDGPAILTTYDIKRQGKPVTGAQVLATLARAVSAIDKENADYYAAQALKAGDKTEVSRSIEAINQRVRKAAAARLDEALKQGRDYITQQVAEEEDDDRKEAVRAKHSANMDRFQQLMAILVPGAKVRMVLPDGEAYTGIVMKVDHGGKANNPLALGTWRATIAAPLNNPMVPVSFASMQANDEDGKIRIEPAHFEPLDATIDLFDQLAAGGAREKRIIATGNILAAFSSLKGRGQIISFTDHQGRKQPGIMMPAKLKKMADLLATIGRPLTTAPEVLDYLKTLGDKPIFSTDRVVEIMPGQWGEGAIVRVPAARGRGGKFFLDLGVLQAAGQDFYKAGPVMRVDVSSTRLPGVVDALLKAGARFEAPAPKKQKDGASESQREAPDGWGEAEGRNPHGEEMAAQVRQVVADIVGPYVQVETPTKITSADPEANRNSGGPGILGVEIGGLAWFRRDALPLVRVSLSPNNADPERVAAHEAFHILQGYGVITEAERGVLQRETPRLRAYLKAKAPWRNSDQMSQKEVEAYAFDTYWRELGGEGAAGGGLHIAIRRVFDRIATILRRIGNALRGLGYRTAEDVFSAASGSEIGRRIGSFEHNLGVNDGVSYSTFSPQTLRDLEIRNMNAGAQPLPARAQPQSSFTATPPTWVDNYRRKVQDEFVTLANAQQDINGQLGKVPQGRDAYLAVTLFPGRTATRLEHLQTDHVDPLIDAIHQAGFTWDEVGVALMARHATERNLFQEARDPTNDHGSGLYTSAAQDLINELQQDGRWQRLLPLMDRAYAIIEADRRTRLRAGLISQQQYDDWRNRFQFYVPLQGTEEIDDDGSPNTGWGFDVRGRESMTAFGRQTIANNPLDNIILMAETGIVRSEKNRVDQSFLKLVQSYPNPDLWVVNERRWIPVLDANGQKKMVLDHSLRKEPNVLGVKVGGKVTYITLKDVGLYEAFKGLPNAQSQSEFMKALGKVTRQYAQLQTTRNPEFVVRNVLRDLQEAGFTLFAENPRLVPAFTKALLPSMKSAFLIGMGKGSAAEKALWDEWRLAGGQISYSNFRDLQDISKETNQKLEELGPLTSKIAVRKALRITDKFTLSAFVRYNEAAENGTRLAVYVAARANGYSMAEAARLSREATVNFTRRGTRTASLNAYKMFFNANVQGTVKLLQMLVMPKGATPEQRKRVWRARKFYAALIPAAYLLTLFNVWMSGDDEDEKRPGKTRSLYLSIPDYDREQNQVFVYGTHVVNGKKMPLYVKIPKAYGLGIPMAVGEGMALMTLGQMTPGQAAAGVMRATIGAFNPLGGAGHLPWEQNFWLNMAAPTMAEPVVNVGLNRDAFGRPIRPPDAPQNQGIPNAEQPFTNTPQWAQNAAHWMRDKTGGVVDVYPGQMSYAADWATGGLGRFVSSSWEAASNAIAGVPTPIEKMPIARKFFGAVGTEAENALYYKNRQAVIEMTNKTYAAKRTLDARPDDAQALRELDEGAGALGLGLKKGRFVRKGSLPDVFTQTDKAIGEQRRAIGAARRDSSLTAAQREQKVDAARNLIDTLQRNARRDAAVFPAYR